MEILIKKSARNKSGFEEIAGQWVEVDTTCLFQDQYDLKNYGVRVMDDDVEAVRNDARAGLCQCNYCGKQGTEAEILRHFEEEDAKALEATTKGKPGTGANCAGCSWRFLQTAEKIEEESHRENESAEGYDVITTTRSQERYYCTHMRDHGTCVRACHRAHKIFKFTSENTYFLKFPNGYDAYFKGLAIGEQWRELGYTWDASERIASAWLPAPAACSYKVNFLIAKNGDLVQLIFSNQRKAFSISAHHLVEFFLQDGRARCFFELRKPTFGEIKQGKNPHFLVKIENAIFRNFPKSYKKNLYMFLDKLKSGAVPFSNRENNRLLCVSGINRLIDQREAQNRAEEE